MRDVMLDLETLSTRHDAVIVSVGLVEFNALAGTIGRSLKVNIDPVVDQRAGGHVDARTVMWWLQQNAEARNSITSGLLPYAALERVSDFIAIGGEPRVWGNGAAFDNVILRHCFDRHDINAPWSYKNDRCYRTIRALGNVDIPFDGVKHDALADAMYQAKVLIKIFQGLRRD